MDVPKLRRVEELGRVAVVAAAELAVGRLGLRLVKQLGVEPRNNNRAEPHLLENRIQGKSDSGLDKFLPEGEFTQGLSLPAKSIPHGSDFLRRKLSALQKAQQSSVRTEILEDGRILYHGIERAARNPGVTRGASLVTEYHPETGRVRQYYESYDQDGFVNRVHPKMIDGQTVDSKHFPPTKQEVKGK